MIDKCRFRDTCKAIWYSSVVSNLILAFRPADTSCGNMGIELCTIGHVIIIVIVYEVYD